MHSPRKLLVSNSLSLMRFHGMDSQVHFVHVIINSSRLRNPKFQMRIRRGLRLVAAVTQMESKRTIQRDGEGLAKKIPSRGWVGC